jgi:hypothetical protein
MDQEGFSPRRKYIAKDRVKERLGEACDELRYCFRYLARQKPAG